MTVSKDRNGKRTSAWETKIAINGRPAGRSERSDTPSSILSSDSDIRFTRKLGSQYRCGCCIIAGFLLLLLVAAGSVYLAYTFILSKAPDEKVFRVNFRVTEGDEFDTKLSDPSTEDFRLRARNYRERLNLIFKRSNLRPAFLKTDILALDGNEDGDDLTVHFNVHFDARRKDVSIRDLMNVLKREINLEESIYLANLTIPIESLIVREANLDVTTPLPTSPSGGTSITTTARPPRKCSPLQMKYCSKVAYNSTSYPNVIGHASYEEVAEDVIAFREIVDSECYHLAYDFVCHILQPPCQKSYKVDAEDGSILPCRSYCHDFMRNCGNRIPNRLREALDCSKFPELSGAGNCISKPGCVEDLHNRNLGSRVCDGVIDCPDLSDEIPCSYCQSNYVHCGVGRHCTHPDKKCDGVADCPNGSDEKNCLSLLPFGSSSPFFKSTIPSSHDVRYHKAGFVHFYRNGIRSKVCADNFNGTDDWELNNLQDFANSVCRSASFEKAVSYRIEEDNETDFNLRYVQLDGNSTFSQTPCSDRNVIKIECENLECGLQSLRSQSGINGLNKMASPGDWPWHVALFKDNVHLCDGTLVSEDWVLTTASCFQGQKKAEWIARFGSTRLGSSSPWNQERRIIGMIKSPVEGSSLVLVKMNEPIVFSDLVRPVCLPDSMTASSNFSTCIALGWSTQSEQLLRTDVKISTMAMCENISITTVNSICGESVSPGQDCNVSAVDGVMQWFLNVFGLPSPNGRLQSPPDEAVAPTLGITFEEEFAGSPLLCLTSAEDRWILVGVSNWRIACQKIGLERPRLYDKTASNLDWIRESFLAA